MQSINALVNFGFFLFQAILIILITYSLGRLINVFFNGGSNLTLNLSSGMLILIVPSWYISWLGNSPEPYLSIVLIVGLSTSLFFVTQAFIQSKSKTNLSRAHHQTIVMASVVAILALWRPISYLAKNGLSTGYFSLGNLDLGNYAMQARVILQSGFDGNNLSIKNIVEGPWGLYDYSGSLIFMSGTRKLGEFFSADFLIPSLVAANTLIFLALFQLVFKFLEGIEHQSTFAWLIASSSILVPLHQYSIGHFFLAQTLGMATVFSALTSMISSFKSKSRNFNDIFSCFSWASLGVFVYAPLGVPSFVGISLWIIFVALRKNWKNSLSTVLIILFFLILIGPQWKWAIRMLLFQTTSNAGWELDGISIQSAVLWSDQLRTVESKFLNLIFILLLAGVIIKIYWNGVNSKLISKIRELSILFFLLIIGNILILSFYEIGSYRMWKAVGFSVVLIVALLLTLLITLSRNQIYAVIFTSVLLGVGISNTSSSWADALNGFKSGTDLSSSTDLVNLSESVLLKEISELNIEVHPGLETMYLSAIAPSLEIFPVSNTYNKGIANYETCTLTRKDMVTDPTLISAEVNNTYVLVNYPSNCKTQ